MDLTSFQHLKTAVARDLTAEQCLDLEAHLREVFTGRASETSLVERTRQVTKAKHCPRCGHDDMVGHGRDKAGHQRFRCRPSAEAGCGRTFNALTGTALARMRPPREMAGTRRADGRLPQRRRCCEQRSRDFQPNGVAPASSAAEGPGGRLGCTLGGVVEAGETFSRTSNKGHGGWVCGTPPVNRPPRYRGGPALSLGISGEQVPVLTAVDCGGAVIKPVLRSRAVIEPGLRVRIKPRSVICWDGLKAYVNVAVAASSEHRRIQLPRTDWLKKAIDGKARRPGRLGLAHVNAHYERVKTFVNRGIGGVSTRYLPVYFGWRRAIRSPGFEAGNLLRDGLSTPT